MDEYIDMPSWARRINSMFAEAEDEIYEFASSAIDQGWTVSEIQRALVLPDIRFPSIRHAIERGLQDHIS